MTTPVTGTAAAPATTAPAKAADPSGFDKDMFLKMLVAQLKFQNPMQPADSSQYMQQMAVFAQVEKLSQLVETQTAAQATQERLSAEALVGMQVTGTDSDGALRTGVVHGVVLDGQTPMIVLQDGSTLPVSTLTRVELAPTPT